MTSAHTDRSMGPDPVLVIEDDEDIREGLRDLLEYRGFPVEVAANGAVALERLRQQGAPKPFLILLDLMMPVMDGFEFRREQVKDRALASIPIVVLSGDADIRNCARDLGAIDGIQKPISVPNLLEVVARCSGSGPIVPT